MNNHSRILKSLVIIILLLPLCSCKSDASKGLHLELSLDRKNYIIGTSYNDEELKAEREIVIPDKMFGIPVTIIDNGAFKEFVNLKTINLPDGITRIGEQAFMGCSSLKNIEISDNVISIGTGAFSYCNNLKYNKYDNGLYLGNEKNPYVVLVTTSSEDITSIKIHSKTKIIMNNALYDCHNLNNIDIPESVIEIGDYAFAYCESLESISIPNSVTSIGCGAFLGCDSLDYYEADNGLYLGNEKNPYVVFVKAAEKTIESITVKDNAKIIMDYAFLGCEKLKKLELPESLIIINYEALLKKEVSYERYEEYSLWDSLEYNEYDNGLYLGNEKNPYVVLVKAKANSVESLEINDETKIIIAENELFINVNTVKIPQSVVTMNNYPYARIIECEMDHQPDGWKEYSGAMNYTCIVWEYNDFKIWSIKQFVDKISHRLKWGDN